MPQGGNLPFGLAPSGSMTSYTPTPRERATDWMRKTLFSDDRAGQERAGKVMDVASLTPFGFGMDVYDAGREAGAGNYGAAGLMLGMAGMPGPSPRQKAGGFKIENRIAYDGINSEDFELRPELLEQYAGPAMLLNGEIIPGKIGDNHATLAEMYGFPSGMKPGFLTKDGRFHFQYVEDLPTP